MNVEHRTFNVQHRIMNSVNLKKKTEQAYSVEMATKAGSEFILRNSTRLSRSTLSLLTLSRSTLSSQPKGSRPKGSSHAAVKCIEVRLFYNR